MPILNINGRKVSVGDEFLSLSPEQQNSTVDEIAASLGGGGPGAKVFELQAGGKVYEVEAPDRESAIAALRGSGSPLPNGPRPWEQDWGTRPGGQASPNVFDQFDEHSATQPNVFAQFDDPRPSPTPQQSNVTAKGDKLATLPADGSFADVASMAADNLVPSAKQFGRDILQIVLDPVGTGKAALKTGLGALEKLVPGEQEHEVYADTVGRFFADRYGGWDNLKRTMATDPVGFAADAATVLTGGQLALARAPGVAGQVGRAAGRVASAIDPISGGIKAVKAASKGVGHVGASLAGVTTGTGGDVVREAARSGFKGGEAAQAFRDNMRGDVPMEDVLTDAKAGLDAIRQERSAAYNAGMTDVRSGTKVLNIGKIDQALNQTRQQYTFKGVTKNPSASAAIQKVGGILDAWKKLDPKQFHTAEGLDALKQHIGSVLESIPYEQKGARQAVSQVYNAVKAQIEQQAPRYAKTMRDYQRASDLVREVERTLSLNPKARVDTQLRKLQSVMRNNVNATYGRRADLVKLLQDKGANNLMAKLAGQAAGSWSARGLARAVQGLQTVGGIGTAITAMNPATLLAMMPTLAMQSPRLVNEAVHAGGRLAGTVPSVSLSRALLGLYATREQPPQSDSPSLASALSGQ